MNFEDLTGTPHPQVAEGARRYCLSQHTEHSRPSANHSSAIASRHVSEHTAYLVLRHLCVEFTIFGTGGKINYLSSHHSADSISPV